MELLYAVLAEAADVAPDGRFHLLGGGLNALEATALPAENASVSLILRLAAEPGEVGVERHLHVDVLGPDGQRLGPPGDLVFTPQANARHPDRRVPVTLLVRFHAIPIMAAGDHVIRLDLDGTPLGEIPFEVILRGGGAPTQPPPAGVTGPGQDKRNEVVG